MRAVAVLGSTGSVGRSALEVLAELAATHRVVALVAQRNADLLVQQARRVRPAVVGLADPAGAAEVRRALAGEGIEVLAGTTAAVDALGAAAPDVVLAAITGAAGLPSTIEAVRRGLHVALANKEALVMAGEHVFALARASGARIVPVDSEHSAIFQAIHREPRANVRRIFLTASGGPFFDLPLDRFPSVTRAEALRHPTWEMGRKITIDSATMMNKALEIVEARHLFDVGAESIEVLVHRQSIVHSMVEFVDGSILAQLGTPCMTVPIRVALAFPDRAPTASSYFDPERFANLTFAAPDHERFPAIAIGHRVARAGGLAGAAMNAANEVAVEWFLGGRARFDRIPATVADVLDRLDNEPDPTLERILATDEWARKEAALCLSR